MQGPTIKTIVPRILRCYLFSVAWLCHKRTMTFSGCVVSRETESQRPPVMREAKSITALTLENLLFMQMPRMSNHCPHFLCVDLKKKLANDERLWGCSQSMDKDTQPLCQVKSHLSIDTIYTTTPAPKVQGTLWKGVQIKEELKEQDILYKWRHLYIPGSCIQEIATAWSPE